MIKDCSISYFNMLNFTYPDYPRQYIIDFLKNLQEAKAVKMDYPCIFDESNVVSLFGIMDPSSKGYISYEQYKTGMYVGIYK